MQNYQDVKDLLLNIAEIFDELLQSESQKLNAIAASDLEALNFFMQEDQAFVMRLKGIDKKRERLLIEMNLSGKTFKELISLTTGDEKTQLTLIYEDLNRKIDQLQSATGSTKKYIDLHLYSLNNLLAQIQPENVNSEKVSRIYTERKA